VRRRSCGADKLQVVTAALNTVNRRLLEVLNVPLGQDGMVWPFILYLVSSSFFSL